MRPWMRHMVELVFDDFNHERDFYLSKEYLEQCIDKAYPTRFNAEIMI